MTIRFHKGDLPDLKLYKNSVAIDTETLGLDIQRDRLCVVQLSCGDGSADVVQIAKGQKEAKNIVKLLGDDKVTKIFHFGRFDIAVLYHAFGTLSKNNFCTKIASKLTRTYTDKHGLKDLCKELLEIDLSKAQQSSDWGAAELSEKQMEYAACDVLYLHKLKDILSERLQREKRMEIAQETFNFLPTRCLLDLEGWEDSDIFAH